MHVLDACQSAEKYINRGKDHWHAKTVLLVPEGDIIVRAYEQYCQIYQGSEEDVLSRFYNAAVEERADYIVRITSDCPLIPPFMISKCVNVAVKNIGDYTSNVDPICRTDPDGMDVEVLSMRALEWLHKSATTPYDREHVTTLIRKIRPSIFQQLHVVGHFDYSVLKCSVDTEEDLIAVRKEYAGILEKLKKAKGTSGMRSVHRI